MSDAAPATTATADPVRVGVLGLGSIGRRHVAMIASQVPQLQLVAVVDQNPQAVEGVASEYDVQPFADADAIIKSRVAEALIVATPHSRHIVIAQPALEAGLHVLVEKPVALSIEGAGRANFAYEKAKAKQPDLVYAAMFQQRLMPVWQRMRQIVREQIGPIRRVHWTVTDWFRTQAYYDTAGWRATWKYEGGGVLMNQAPHNLDLLLWITGLVPRSVFAVTRYGRFHDIQTEDEVAATIVCDPVDDSPGPLLTFVTSTGEAPGSNRLEIVGDDGTVVAEDGEITLRLLAEAASATNATGEPNLRTMPLKETQVVPAEGGSPSSTKQDPFRRGMFENFAAAVRHQTPLVAPAREGYASVELANAMLLSGDRRKTITLPLDVDDYQTWLAEKTAAADVR
jgi:predicted dehydrogenase